MNKYLNVLKEIKNNEINNPEIIISLNKLESYIKGEITSEKLMNPASFNHINNIYYGINKLLNYDGKRIKYFVELPVTATCSTLSSKGIVKAELKELRLYDDIFHIIGPYDSGENEITFSKNMYVEVDGDFKAYPKGVKIYPVDWYQIILKYPHLINRMYYLNELENPEFKKHSPSMIEFIINLEALIKENIKVAKAKEKKLYNFLDCHHLSKEELSSIKMVIPVEYITIDVVKAGHFGSFTDIRDGKYQALEEQPRLLLKK